MHQIKSLEHSIRATLHYFDIFDHPLSLDELWRYLYAFYAEDMRDVVHVLERMDDVVRFGPYYVLKGREQIADARRKRLMLEEKFWGRVGDFRWLFAAAPFVKFVGVCNSLAYGNVHAGSDIDLFVIAEKGRLGSARFFMKVLTQLFGVRMHHDKKAMRFCLSFFVTDDALDLQPLAHDFDPYLAYFVRTLVPVAGSKKLYIDFLRANEHWVAPYGVYYPRLERFKESAVAENGKPQSIGRQSTWYNKNVERFLFDYQHERDHRRVGQKSLEGTGVVMNERIFKCNEVDRRKEFADAFRKKLEILNML
ncbi:hypothetical protein COV82_01570 [Candidatus Peregrinibacteria bacterium CG11_big_fil_rev_8_21_14_0_20_46_8]|nr:MAG: hypothetical protein COV82_01570 [Candidatus Peregrinibacteria bacterium CG11_big_fil_rev_8_21_14_0_20_46_8]